MIGEYFRVFVSYGVITLALIMYETKKRRAKSQGGQLLAQAQKYTEDFAAGVFEGLYIATPETHVLTHTAQGAIGITTRPGDSLNTFQERHSGPTGADQLGHHAVPRHRQHDPVYVLPHL